MMGCALVYCQYGLRLFHAQTYATGVVGTADPRSARIAGGSDAIPLDGVDVGGGSVWGTAVFIAGGRRGVIVPKGIKPFILSSLFKVRAGGTTIMNCKGQVLSKHE
jgi:hypothetical protein